MTTAEDLPRNYVLAVVDGQDSAAKALADLTTGGFAETLSLKGDEFQQAVGSNDEKTGNFISRALKSIPEALSEESDYLAQYQEEAQKGRYIVAVKADNRDRAEAAADILRGLGARNARLFGSLQVSDLSGQANPSAASPAAPVAPPST
jgi:hypothetical protein